MAPNKPASAAPKKNTTKPTQGSAPPAKKSTHRKVNINGDRIDAEQRKKLFAYEFHHNGANATQAALVAGYSQGNATTQGSQLLTDPYVIATLQALSAQSARASIAEAIEVHEVLTEILRGQTMTPYVTKNGVVHDIPSAADRIKAGSELQKMRGGYAPVRVEHVVRNQVDLWLQQTLVMIQQELKLPEQKMGELLQRLPVLQLENGK